jgi:hypothetical protein
VQLNYCPSDGLEGLCLVDRLCGTKEQCVLLPFRAGHFAKVEGRKVVFDWYSESTGEKFELISIHRGTIGLLKSSVAKWARIRPSTSEKAAAIHAKYKTDKKPGKNRTNSQAAMAKTKKGERKGRKRGGCSLECKRIQLIITILPNSCYKSH